jgi:hypothetical protein
MVTTSPAAKPCMLDRVKPYLVPYYLTLLGLIGAITVGFVVLIGLLVLVVTNFNVLGWME